MRHLKLRLELLGLRGSNDPNSTVKMALIRASLKSKDALVALIDEQMAGLRPSAKMDSYYAAWGIADNLRTLLLGIEAYLAPVDINAAFEKLLDLIELHKDMLKYIDDYESCIQSIFYEAVVTLRRLANNIVKPIDAWVDLVFQCVLDNRSGIFDGVIPYFQDILGQEGLEQLEKRIASSKQMKDRHMAKRALALIDECRYMQKIMSHKNPLKQISQDDHLT